MKVIGFGGLAKAGKTTAANMLAAHIYNKKLGLPKIRSFAGPLKQAALAVGADKIEKPELYRKFCQIVGTDMMRNPEFVPGETGPDYWASIIDDMLKEEVEKDYSDANLETIIIFDDVRFANEMQVVKRWGGKLVYVMAAARGVLPSKEGWRAHESEQLAVDSMKDPQGSGWGSVLPSVNLAAMENLIQHRCPFWIGAKLDARDCAY